MDAQNREGSPRASGPGTIIQGLPPSLGSITTKTWPRCHPGPATITQCPPELSPIVAQPSPSVHHHHPVPVTITQCPPQPPLTLGVPKRLGRGSGDPTSTQCPPPSSSSHQHHPRPVTITQCPPPSPKMGTIITHCSPSPSPRDHHSAPTITITQFLSPSPSSHHSLSSPWGAKLAGQRQWGHHQHPQTPKFHNKPKSLNQTPSPPSQIHPGISCSLISLIPILSQTRIWGPHTLWGTPGAPQTQSLPHPPIPAAPFSSP